MPDYTTQKVVKAGEWSGAFDQCLLTYDARFLRRKVIETVHYETLLVDLPKATHLDDRDAFELTDGRFIEILAAREELYIIKGDLARLAWHIGNRHTPCGVERDHLVIQRNPVLRNMLEGLGAEVEEAFEPFIPEGGAYGHGRTHGHSHSDIHGNGHDHSHDH